MITEVLQNESTAAMRTLTVVIKNPNGVSGVSLTGGTPAVLKLAKQGGNFTTPTTGTTLTEITGGVDGGVYDLQLVAADLDTVGELRLELSSGTGPPFPTIPMSITVIPPKRSVDFADGFLTNAKIADGFLTAAKLSANTIAAAAIASGAITSAKFAADAIDANALKADAATEIGAAVWAALVAANHSAGSMGDAIMFLMAICRGNVVLDQVVDGDVPGIITSLRLRGFADGAATAAADPSHANGADGEVIRGTFTCVDEGGGLWSSMKFQRTL